MSQINPSVGDIVRINDATVPAKNGKQGKIVRIPDFGRTVEGPNRFKVELDGGVQYVTSKARDLYWVPAVAPTAAPSAQSPATGASNSAGGLRVGDHVTVNCPEVPTKTGKSGTLSVLPNSGNGNRFEVRLSNGETFKTRYATNLLITTAPVAASVAAVTPAAVRQAVVDTTFALGNRVKVIDNTVPAKNGKEGEVDETPSMRADRRYKVSLFTGGTYFTSKATDLLLLLLPDLEGDEVAADDEEYDDTYEEGDRVRVTDLSVPGKNGRSGVVVGVPGERGDHRYKVQLDNGECYWTGHADDLSSSTAALAGSNAKAAQLGNQTLEQDLKKEHTVMNVLKSTLEDNKANALFVARVEAGKLIILQITDRIKPLLPMYAQGYMEHPASGLVIANLLAFSQKQWMADNKKAGVLADCAMKAAMLNAGAALEIPKYINDAINGALGGFDFSKLGL